MGITKKLFFSILSLFLLLSFSYGGMKWEDSTHFSSKIVSKPVSYSNSIYVLTEDGIVYSVGSTDGYARVAYSLDDPSNVPMITGSRALVFGSNNGKIDAYSLKNGEHLWSYPSKPLYMLPSEEEEEQLHLKYLAYSSGTVYAVFSEKIIALHEATGQELFTRSLYDGKSAYADDKRVYVSDGANLHAFTKEGNLLWSVVTGELYKTHPVADETNGHVYVASTSGLVMAFSSASGQLLWNYPLEGWAMSTPATDGFTVVFGSNDGKIRGVSATSGKLLWETDVQGSVWSEPALLTKEGKTIAIFGTNNNSLVAIDISNGNLLFDYQTTSWANSPTVSSDGRTILFSTRDNSLWAVNAYPICTIDYPRTNEIIPPEFELIGRAFSFGGINSVQLIVNQKTYPPLTLRGESEFTYELDLSNEPIDIVRIQCLAQDSNGLEETDLWGSKSEPILSLSVPKLNMSITPTPPSAEPGEEITVYIRNENGYDMENVLLEFGGKNQSVSSPTKLTAPEQGGAYTLVARKARYHPAQTQIYVRTDLGVLPIAGLVILIIFAIAAYFLFAKKKKLVEFNMKN
ncbi:MAG: PQQ-binding-like beta-propeller repeat protein [Candidatus Micrarchaeota archaeon]